MIISGQLTLVLARLFYNGYSSWGPVIPPSFVLNDGISYFVLNDGISTILLN